MWAVPAQIIRLRLAQATLAAFSQRGLSGLAAAPECLRKVLLQELLGLVELQIILWLRSSVAIVAVELHHLQTVLCLVHQTQFRVS